MKSKLQASSAKHQASSCKRQAASNTNQATSLPQSGGRLQAKQKGIK